MKILKVVMAILFVSSTAFASDAFVKKAKAGSLKVEYSSIKPLVVGYNDIEIVVKKGSKVFDGAKVTFKIFMPEMPGMPYMDDIVEANEIEEGVYRVKSSISMGGTWQVRIYIERDGKKYRAKSSIIL